MVALTILNEVAGIVKPEYLLKAILTRVPTKFADLNRDAFSLGQELSEVE
jgi:Pyruvate/2-oxoacid:ferredoxin oxidoreductase gamma subunit